MNGLTELLFQKYFRSNIDFKMVTGFIRIKMNSLTELLFQKYFRSNIDFKMVTGFMVHPV